MKHDELLGRIKEGQWVDRDEMHTRSNALRAIVELHKPYDIQDTPHAVAMGWCKGCSIEYSINEYASQPYPCPTIQAIEKELA